MTEFVLHDNQKPSEETLKRVSELKDEDIVFDEDCPKMTHEMEKVLTHAVVENNRLKRH